MTEQTYQERNVKRVYYLSLEFTNDARIKM